MRWLVLGACLALGAALLTRGAGSAGRPPGVERELTPRPLPDAPPGGEWDAPSRDPFRYVAPTVRPAAPVIVDRARSTPPSPVATVPPVKLVGLVRRGAQIKAALGVNGEVLIAGVGEVVGAYTVLSIEDDAVRLRDAVGAEIVVSPQP
jgi:hypothetical protein